MNFYIFYTKGGRRGTDPLLENFQPRGEGVIKSYGRKLTSHMVLNKAFLCQRVTASGTSDPEGVTDGICKLRKTYN